MVTFHACTCMLYVTVFTCYLYIGGIRVHVPRLFIQTWIEALRQIFHWPKYINTATFVISLISILLLIALRIVNVKAVSKIKCAFCRYSRRSRTCSVSRTWKWPIPIPSPLLLVSRFLCAHQCHFSVHVLPLFSITVWG